MKAWGDTLRHRVLGSLTDLAHVARHPRLYATAARQARGLVEEFMEGGVEVNTSIPLDVGSNVLQAVIVRTVVQTDGDVQLIVYRSFRDLPAERKQVVLDQHFEALEARLAPLVQVAELTRALRAAVWPVGGLGVVGSGTSYLSGTMVLWVLASVLPSVMLLVFPSIVPKLLWWWLRRRMTRSARVG